MARRYAGQGEWLAVALLVCGAVFGHTVARADDPAAEPVLRLEAGAHTAVINRVAVTRDGKLLTVSDDKTARLWSREGGAPLTIRVPIGPKVEGALYAVAASPANDSAVVGGFPDLSWDQSGSVYGVDLTTGKISGRLEMPRAKVYSLAYSKDGHYLAVGTGEEPAVRIFDRAARSVVLEDTAYGGPVVAAQFLPDGRLVTASLDGKVRLYDGSFHLSASHVVANNAHPWRLAVSPDGDKIAVGADGPTVEVLSANGLGVIKTLSPGGGSGGALRAVAWIGTRVFAAGAQGNSTDNRLYSWDLSTGKTTDLPLAADTVSDLAVLPDNSIAFATAEPSLGVFNPQTQRLEWLSKRMNADFRDAGSAFRVSADGSTVQFPTQQKGRGLVSFDLNERKLVSDASERSNMAAPGGPCGVSNWNNATDPKLQGVPIPLQSAEYARSVAALPDCSTILLGADFSLRLLRGGSVVWTARLQAPAWAVNLTKDKRYALAALGDGTIRWFDARDGAEVLCLFALRDGRWIVWTTEGYFDHARGSADLVGYHVNHGKAADPEFVRTGQLYDRFFRPDLVALKFRGEDLTQTVAETGGDATTVVKKHVPPELRLLGWCASGKCNEGGGSGRAGAGGPVNVDTSNVTLRVAVADRGSGVGNVVVRRNGAAVRAAAKPDSRDPQVADYAIELAEGDNQVTVTASDAQNTVEAPAPVAIDFLYGTAGGTQANRPKLYVLAVGLNNYAAAKNSLNNAVNDAKVMADELSRPRGDLFQPGRTELLTDDQATLANIKAAFQRMAAAARPEDVAIIFLSGHGTTVDGKYYFPVYDSTIEKAPPNSKLPFKRMAETWLTHDELESWITALPAGRVAVLIDTCHAGALAVSEVATHQAPNAVQDRTWSGSIGQKTGRFILAGSRTDETAGDGGENRHGVFTAVILKGLAGDADNAPKDNKVNIYELGTYAEDHLEAASHQAGGEQHASWYFAGNKFFDLAELKTN
jgi:WD40 repeat protein